ncbi:MAG: hypothetical protein KGH98_01780 [Candidatus Micrarchaeota archaeon]|nr:hypothetical protein [Candidatus Micrarchaeota archaeon]
MDTTNSRMLRTRLDALAIEFGLRKLPRIPRPVIADSRLYPFIPYLAMSQGRGCMGFGATPGERTANISSFVYSDAYNSMSESMGACSVDVEELRNAVSMVGDEKLRRNLESLLARCDSLHGRAIILSEAGTSQAADRQSSMFYHELVHMLLLHNRVCPPAGSSTASRWRKFCEGLAIFMQHYFEEYGARSMAFVKAYAEGKENGSQFYEYAMYASRIGRVFERARTPEARRAAISRLLPNKNGQNKQNLSHNFGDNRRN